MNCYKCVTCQNEVDIFKGVCWECVELDNIKCELCDKKKGIIKFFPPNGIYYCLDCEKTHKCSSCDCLHDAPFKPPKKGCYGYCW